MIDESMVAYQLVETQKLASQWGFTLEVEPTGIYCAIRDAHGDTVVANLSKSPACALAFLRGWAACSKYDNPEQK